jgi:acyl carrier protein
MKDRIRAIIREHARLTVDANQLTDASDLYQAGMSSHASVNVMLALEGEFGIEFPDRMLRRGVFQSIDSISAAVEELRGGGG